MLGKWYFKWQAIFMAIKARMDSAGRIVIPKELRERYGFDRGIPLRIIPLPDGVSIVAEQRERRFIRIGPILAIETGVDSARIDEFDIDRLRDNQLDSKQP
jgi:bifunctional DNA-binding transcriptional regulator/antitoxin component of YhaV-PrlF toxin-antitoxin module